MSAKLILTLIGMSLAIGIIAIVALFWLGGQLEEWREKPARSRMGRDASPDRD